MAFVPGRAMSKNIIISLEFLHYINRKKGWLGHMAIKMDMAKAYSKVEWPILLKLLKIMVLMKNL